MFSGKLIKKTERLIFMDKNSKQKPSVKKIRSVKITSKKTIKSDVQGSYTGVPADPYEKPVQDADDL